MLLLALVEAFEFISIEMKLHKQGLDIFLGCILCATSVIAGAFGAHALHDILESNSKINVFELAVQYQFKHGLALLMLGILRLNFPQKSLIWASALIFFGTICFSGSLYLLSFVSIGSFALITPLGGLLLIAGWICLAFFAYRRFYVS